MIYKLFPDENGFDNDSDEDESEEDEEEEKESGFNQYFKKRHSIKS